MSFFNFDLPPTDAPRDKQYDIRPQDALTRIIRARPTCQRFFVPLKPPHALRRHVKRERFIGYDLDLQAQRREPAFK